MMGSHASNENQEEKGANPDVPKGEDVTDVSEEFRETIRNALPRDLLGVDELDRVVDSVADALSVGVVSVVHQVEQTTQTSFKGPLPPPDTLASYEEVMPGLSERIVKMAEQQLAMADQQQEFRHEIGRGNLANERMSLEDQARLSNRGMLAAFVLAITAVLGGIYITVIGQDARGIAAILVPLAILAGVFITGKILEAKRKTPMDNDEGASE